MKKKEREIETYDAPDQSRNVHGSIWNDEHLHQLLNLGAESQFETLLKQHTGQGAALVIGCSGKDIDTIYDFNSERLTAGIDIAKSPLDEAQQNLQDNSILLCRGDAERLPFADDTFSTVVARATLHHLPNLSGQGLKEIIRVLCSDGCLIFFQPGVYSPPAAVRRLLFPSQSHTPDEKPFAPDDLSGILGEYFSEVEVNGHYIFSNILPVLDRQVPVNIPHWIYELEQSVPGNNKLSRILVGKAKYPLK